MGTGSGIRKIPLDAISGTVEPSRASPFDHDFRPAAPTRTWWQRVWLAEDRATVLPPISVIEVGDMYATRDGHHGVSVAKCEAPSRSPRRQRGRGLAVTASRGVLVAPLAPPEEAEAETRDPGRPARRRAYGGPVGPGPRRGVGSSTALPGAHSSRARGAAARCGYAHVVTASDPEPGVPLDTTARREPAATEPEPESELTSREAGMRERESRRRGGPEGMVPARERRRTKLERGLMRLIATGGIIGIAVVLGAVLVGQDVAGWIVGLAVGLTSVILAALLWSSRQL
jgi:hypothetical protein